MLVASIWSDGSNYLAIPGVVRDIVAGVHENRYAVLAFSPVETVFDFVSHSRARFWHGIGRRVIKNVPHSALSLIADKIIYLETDEEIEFVRKTEWEGEDWKTRGRFE